jgi:uncharacterized protein
MSLSVVGSEAPLCSRCDAVCCRLTVVLMEEDRIPGHLTTRTAGGLTVMARDEDGWCVGLDAAHMRCGIYEARPRICRRFEMAGPYCHAVRAEYRAQGARHIPISLE